MTQRLQVLLLVAFGLIWFSNLDYRKLVNPDEGRYAEIPREMVASGDWTTPRLNDIKYIEKPALQYWATATAYTLFGEHQWTARLWSALTGFFGVLMVFFTGRRLFGDEAGWNSALVLASSLLYVLIGHVNTLDMGVSFLLSAAVCAFCLAQSDATDARARRHWMLAEHGVGGRRGPVLQRGLFEIFEAVQTRRDPVAARHHLARDLGVAPLVGVDQFAVFEIGEPDETEDD